MKPTNPSIFKFCALALTFLLFACVGGCASNAWAAIPTPVAALAEAATEAAPAAMTQPAAAGSTVAPLPAEPPAEATPVPLPASLPAATILSAPNVDQPVVILTPGEGSRVVSPLKPEIAFQVGNSAQAQLELNGKGGILYARQVLDLRDKGGQKFIFQPAIPFEITDAMTPVRLDVRLLDGLGRITALASVNLSLQYSGESMIQAGGSTGSVQIKAPTDGAEIAGKKVLVKAGVRPINDEPIVAELVTEDGIALNTRLVNLPEDAPAGQFVPLDFNVPFAVSEPTPCLLRLYQGSYNQIKGILMLSSVPVTLMP